MTSRQRIIIVVLIVSIVLGNGLTVYYGQQKAIRYIDGTFSVANAKQVNKSESVDLQSAIDSKGNKHDLVSCTLIHVNWASLEQLQELPGIGLVLAQRIIDTRDQAYFIELEDLLRVPGIGVARLEQISSHVCLALPDE